MALGTNVRIPGQLLFDPLDYDGPGLQDLAHKVKIKTTNPAVQPSSHAKPEAAVPPLPENVTHVYTREHQTTGLQTPYQGPFFIADRPSRSTVKIEVGVYKNGEKRYEVRHVNDLKPAHPDSFAAPFSRPQLGRPPGTSTPASTTKDTEEPEAIPVTPSPSNLPVVVESKQTSESGKIQTRPTRTTRNPCPKYIDAIWTATPSDLARINLSISGSQGSV